MQSFQTRFRTGLAALGLLAAATLPASAATLNFQFTSVEATGSGSAVFDTTGAPSLDPYEYRAGDTFHASLDFGSVVIDFTEADAVNPVMIFFQSGDPADIFFAGSIYEGPGRDLGMFDFISLTMSEGAFSMQAHYDTGEEATMLGTYAIVQDEPPPTSVPEPASAALVGAGLAALVWRRRRA